MRRTSDARLLGHRLAPGSRGPFSPRFETDVPRSSLLPCLTSLVRPASVFAVKSIYSLYEAKARLSEIIRRVREHGETITLSYHGEPVAEIRPLPPAEDDVARRLAHLERTGVLVPPSREGADLPTRLARRPGALARFLEERD